MVNRSRVEIEWVTHLCDILGLGTSTTTVMDALKNGAQRGLFDCYIDLGRVHIYGEYDGGRYHDASRCNNDVEKSLRAVANDPLAIVVRARVKAAPLTISDARICVVSVEHTRMDKLVADTANALRHLLPEPHSSFLKNVQCQRRPVAEYATTEVLCIINRTFDVEFCRLVNIVGQRGAQRLSKLGGAKTKMEHGMYSDAVTAFKTELDLNASQLVTFMGNSIATRIEDVAFRNAVTSFKTELDLNASQLVTLMGNSIATRIEDVAFRASCARLCRVVPISLLGVNQVACRLLNVELVDRLVDQASRMSRKRTIQVCMEYPIL